MDYRKRNSGFSLIELIITIAIMAIVIGVSVSVYNLIGSSRMTSMAENVDSSISDLRTTTLAKADNYRLIIYKDGGKYFSLIEKGTFNPSTGNTTWSEYEKVKISDYGSIYCFGNSGTKLDIGTKNTDYKILISFNKASRAFNQISCYSNNDTGYTHPISIMNNEIHMDYSERTRIIKMLEETGKHYIK